MRKILLGAVTIIGLFVLTASGASSAQSNRLSVTQASPAHGMVTDVYYRHWRHRRWHHWRRWHRWHR
jgi:hypothetical protein